MSDGETGIPTIQQVLETYINSMRHPADGQPSLNWLADEIDQQLSEAELAARREWLALHPLSRPHSDHVLSDAEHMRIALQTAYHHLVSIPRMWIYVYEYWRQQAPNGILLYPEDSLAPLELSPDDARPLAQIASDSLRELLDRLKVWFPEESAMFDWLDHKEMGHHDH